MYCVKCKRKTDSKNKGVKRTSNNRKLATGECSVCGSKKTCFIKSDKRSEGGSIENLNDSHNEEMSHYAKHANNAYVPNDERSDNFLGYTLDKDLSNDETAVYADPKTKKLVVSYRGSKTATDWIDNNTLIAAGLPLEYTKRFDSSKKTLEDAKQSYPGYDTTITGHSLAGRLANDIGAATRTPSRGYNVGSSPMDIPSIARKYLKCYITPSACEWSKKNSINYWSKGDPVGVSHLMTPTRNIIVPTKAKNIGGLHSIKNFLP